MPVRTVEFHPLAERELASAQRWYHRRSPSTAHRFLQAVDQVIQRMADAAEQGSPYQQDFRWMRVKRFPYVFYYEIQDPHRLVVYAVAHSSRRPGYWRRRQRP